MGRGGLSRPIATMFFYLTRIPVMHPRSNTHAMNFPQHLGWKVELALRPAQITPIPTILNLIETPHIRGVHHSDIAEDLHQSRIGRPSPTKRCALPWRPSLPRLRFR